MLRNELVAQHPYLKKELLTLSPWRRRGDIPAVSDHDRILYTLNARSALELSLECCRIGDGDEVLVPAYHCPVMIFPITRAKAKPVFYRINEDLTVNVNDLEQKISQRTRAIIVVHYFGFPSNIMRVKELALKSRIPLIEDCAHAFFGSIDGKPLGSFGDFAVASFWKFFPVYHGGMLRLNTDAKLIRLRVRSPFFEMKSALNTIEIGFNSDGSSTAVEYIFRLKDTVWRSLRQKGPDSSLNFEGTVPVRHPYAWNLIAETYSRERMPLFSKAIFRTTPVEEIIRKRRSNYLTLLEVCSRLSHVKPVFAELPDSVVPYVFPVLADNSDNLANNLRKAGVGILRFGEYLWDEVNEKTCDVSHFYARNCIQLPLHQCVLPDKLRYMCHTLEVGSG